MAASQAKHARVTLVLENVKEFRSMKSGDALVPEGESDCKPSSVVEHLVLFNMPYLQGDQEAAILRALYDLQFQFENITVLIVGRVLNKVENTTHALFMRFPNVEILLAYYKSDALRNVAAIMTPHLHGEICVDYLSATGYLDTTQRDPICATATFFRRKRDVRPDEVDCALHSLVAAVDDVSYVKDFTVGSNLFLRGDKFYTHGFAGYVKAVGDLDKLAEDSDYTKEPHTHHWQGELYFDISMRRNSRTVRRVLIFSFSNVAEIYEMKSSSRRCCLSALVPSLSMSWHSSLLALLSNKNFWTPNVNRPSCFVCPKYFDGVSTS